MSNKYITLTSEILNYECKREREREREHCVGKQIDTYKSLYNIVYLSLFDNLVHVRDTPYEIFRTLPGE